MTSATVRPSTTVRQLFTAIDHRDVDAIASLMAHDLHFRFGNAEATETKADFTSVATAFLGSLAGIRHEIHHLWEVDGETVVAVMDVHYERTDGRRLTLPCCNVLRVSDGAIRDYRIYMDINPVMAD